MALRREGFGKEASPGAVELLRVANLGELDPLGGVRGLLVPLENCRQPLIEGGQALLLAHPFPGGIAPVRLLGTQLVSPPVAGQSLAILPFSCKSVAEVTMGLGVIRLEAEGFAIGRDRSVQGPLG